MYTTKFPSKVSSFLVCICAFALYTPKIAKKFITCTNNCFFFKYYPADLDLRLLAVASHGAEVARIPEVAPVGADPGLTLEIAVNSDTRSSSIIII
jgi:hypothetical protein